MAVNGKIALKVEMVESQSRDMGTAILRHLLDLSEVWAPGTANGRNVDRVWSDRRTVSAADDLDLLGTLTSMLDGSTLSFVDVAGFVIKNESALGSGLNLTVGAASSPFIGWAASGAGVILKPQGVLLWTCPDGAAPTASTGDTLTLTPSAGLTYSITVWGRSA